MTEGRAIVWARSDRHARMVLEYDTTDRLRRPPHVVGPYAEEKTDYTTRIDLPGLPLGQTIFDRVSS